MNKSIKDYAPASTSIEVEKCYREYRIIKLNEACFKTSEYLNDLIKAFKKERSSLFSIRVNELVDKCKVFIKVRVWGAL